MKNGLRQNGLRQNGHPVLFTLVLRSATRSCSILAGLHPDLASLNAALNKAARDYADRFVKDDWRLEVDVMGADDVEEMAAAAAMAAREHERRNEEATP